MYSDGPVLEILLAPEDGFTVLRIMLKQGNSLCPEDPLSQERRTPCSNVLSQLIINFQKKEHKPSLSSDLWG